jgi:hypothetical protein
MSANSITSGTSRTPLGSTTSALFQSQYGEIVRPVLIGAVDDRAARAGGERVGRLAEHQRSDVRLLQKQRRFRSSRAPLPKKR